jgi:hypothetical protein
MWVEVVDSLCVSLLSDREGLYGAASLGMDGQGWFADKREREQWRSRLVEVKSIPPVAFGRNRRYLDPFHRACMRLCTLLEFAVTRNISLT